MMKASPHSNGVHRELTKIPEMDLTLARQEAARIAQAAEAARQHEHISGGMQHYRTSSPGRKYGDISTSGLTSIPTMPQAGVSAFTPYASCSDRRLNRTRPICSSSSLSSAYCSRCRSPSEERLQSGQY